jgi:hypothetical protein
LNTTIKDLLLLRGRISNKWYFVVGVSLFLVKYLIDSAIAAGFGRNWSPLNYLIWPDHTSLFVFQLPAPDRRFGLALLAAALPFIWIGTTLTLQRLRDARLPLLFVLLFFVPLVNLLLIAALCLLPSQPEEPNDASPSTPHQDSNVVRRLVAGERTLGSFWFACIVSAAITLGFVFVSANVLASYGFGLFVGAPFFQGWLAAVLYGLWGPRTRKECTGVAAASLSITGVALLFVAMEGMLCILMAAPLAFPLSMLGAMMGHSMQWRPHAGASMPAVIVGLFVTTPALITAEAKLTRPIPMREVHTEVVVDAPQEVVWKRVVAFPPLPPPTEWLFRTGIAYPKSAEIRGVGVGAVRLCVFSTGAFVEPIETWDPPRCLAFRVTEQPAPMEEWSPFDIHPPHLDNFLVSRQGRFQLEALPGGRTRLVGATVYTNKMWPAPYWGLWSDAIIHAIHHRVLDHVKSIAENDRKGD